MTVLATALGLETLHAAMPFGRLMPLHYGPDDVRTIIVSKSQTISAQLSSLNLFSEKVQAGEWTRENCRSYAAASIDRYIGLFWKSIKLVLIPVAI